MSYEYLLRPVRNTLLPPNNVRGMKILDREKFRKPLKVFTLLCPKTLMPIVIPKLKPFILKLEKLKPIRLPESIPESIVARSQADPLLQNMREIIFNPLKIESWHNLPVKFLEDRNILADHFSFDEIELTYDNWGAAVILRSVLPLRTDAFKSFSCVGHIVHVNLRQHLLPYKQIIGQVLFDKVPNCRTVVNKSAVITNEFRFFEFELLCGEPLYEVETKENGFRYKLDFSSVYWNPRLSTEHQRIADIIESHDVLYDVFAGIGPFAVPAAGKGATVIANDLNPESVRWLQHNIELNAKNADAKCYNMDGAVFIRQIVKVDLIKRWRAQSSIISLGYNMYIVMNLPDTALTFLTSFRGLFEKEVDQIQFDLPEFKFPHIFCYTFAKGPLDEAEDIIRLKVRQLLRMPIDNILKDIQFVRNVAPKNNMYRVRLQLNKTLLTTSKHIKQTVILHDRKILETDIAVHIISDDLESEIEEPQQDNEEIGNEQQQDNEEIEDDQQQYNIEEIEDEEEEDNEEIENEQQQDNIEEIEDEEEIDNEEIEDEQQQDEVKEQPNVVENEATLLGKRSNSSPSDEKMIIGDQVQVVVDVEEPKKRKPSSLM